MNKRKTTFGFLLAFLFSIIFGYSLVFAGDKGKISFKLSNNIIIDSLKLNQNRVIIKSKENLENSVISGDCGVSGKLNSIEKNYYIFDVFVLDKTCRQKNIKVNFKKEDFLISTTFNVSGSYKFYSEFLDLSDEKLKKKILIIDKGIKKLEKYRKYDKKYNYSSLEFLKSNRRLFELEYIKKFLFNILEKRQEKYIIPVLGAELPTKENKLPNAGRPYRNNYTDGVHHGWDFDSDFGDNVLSLDDGIIIRVVENFSDYDFYKIKYGNNLSSLDKTRNLDILRGKQVWVKTMKGDVAFYSHLDNIFSNIKEGSVVSKGQPLGTVGKTGVPDKNYSDYHLHIPIHKNPFLAKNNYSLDDYFAWDWYFKGKSASYILENQKNIFE